VIRVEPQPEPADFDGLVRQPGKAFLKEVPSPTSKQWTGRSYWRKVVATLHDVYGGICAYSCHWIPHDTGGKTVEHFRPKSLYPQEAYEWSNYRLVCATLNGRKGDYEGVLDPFEIEDGWFVLDFPSMLVKPAADLEAGLRAKVLATRNRLKLNDDESCVKARLRYVRLYCEMRNLPYLHREAPFIAREIERQRLVDTLPDIMGFD
jgi:hypothetical protein